MLWPLASESSATNNGVDARWEAEIRRRYPSAVTDVTQNEQLGRLMIELPFYNQSVQAIGLPTIIFRSACTTASPGRQRRRREPGKPTWRGLNRLSLSSA